MKEEKKTKKSEPQRKTEVDLPIEPFGSHPDAKKKPAPLIAKKDFTLHHNEYRRTIKVGDDLSDVPELYHPNLRTEGVL